MLGITTPDAIALGSMLAALLAAFAGLVQGARAKREAPPDPGMALIGSALVDRATLQDLTDAVRDLVAVMRAGVAAGLAPAHPRDPVDDVMRELVDRIDRRRGL